MKYERLKNNIEILKRHNLTHEPVSYITDGKKHEIDLINEIVEDCEKILNDEEQGLIVKLPCKVGDTFYRVTQDCGIYRIIEDKVFGFIIRPSMEKENRKVLICNSWGTSFWLGESNYEPYEFVTLNKAEAEKRLEEIKK